MNNGAWKLIVAQWEAYKKKKNPQECMTAEHPWISNQEDVWKNLSLVNQIAWGNEIMQKCG